MKHLHLTAIALAICLSAAAKDYSIENASLRRTLSIEHECLATKEIENKLAATTTKPTACDEFRLRISRGSHVEGTDVWLTAADFKATHVSGTWTEQVFSLESRKHGLMIEVRYELKPQDFYARKQLEVTAERPVTLERIDVEAISFADANQPYTVKSITAYGGKKWSPGLGQPLYTTNSATFWGIEFPAAYNHVDNKKMLAGYLWGYELRPGQTYESKKAVVGVADDPQFNREAFFEYIDRVRARPLRLQTQYNSWFNGGRNVTREQFAASIETISRELNAERGVKPLRAYVIDNGWQTMSGDWTKKAWQTNSKFDIDFATSFANTTAAGSELGLWMSPGCVFTGARWAVPVYRKAGFESLGHYMSLAGPKYMGLLEDRMVELTKMGVSYFKLDGLFGQINTRDFELNGNRYGIPYMPQLGTEGMASASRALNQSKYDELKTYYLAAGSERLIQIFDKMHAINPEIYIVISNGAYLSPWWLMHIDAVWMINCGDAARGADRTGELTYRDGVYHQIYAKEDTQFPMHSLFNHEPKKRETGESKKTFRDYLYMNMSRGTGFVELYITPGVLQESDWDVLAEGLHWVHDVFPLFKRARMHGGNPYKNETYGYTAWNQDRGFISIHNPSDKTHTYTVTLDRAFGLVPDSKNFQLSSPIAESVEGLKKDWKYADTLSVKLQPREVRILNFDYEKKDWSKLIALQTRTKEAHVPESRSEARPAKAVGLKAHPILGVWTYSTGRANLSREFTVDGQCVLRKGRKTIWTKPYTVNDAASVTVGGAYKHILKNGQLEIEGKYLARRKSPTKSESPVKNVPPAKSKSPAPAPLPTNKKNFHVFLLMGQSNMSGFVNMAVGDYQPVPHVLKMRYAKEGDEPKWVPGAHPLHPNRPHKKKRFGPGMSFAQTYVANTPGVVVGLIPMAWGGRDIARLDKGSAIYSDAIRHAKAAKQTGTLKGVLWHQGESDTVEQAKTDVYEKRLHSLIADVRKDLGDAQLPFIVGNLAEFYGTGKDHNAPDRAARISKIKGILRSLPDRVPHTGFVESTGCSSAASAKVHFDRKSCVLLGKRYAEVYADMMDEANKDTEVTP